MAQNPIITKVNVGGQDYDLFVTGLSTAAYQPVEAFAPAITTEATIAASDKLVIATGNNDPKVSSIAFDGSTDNKFLSQKGTWEEITLASTTEAGLVQVGDNLAIDGNGVLSVKSSPVFTGVPEVPYADGSVTTQITNVQYVQDAIEEGIRANDAMIFKGVVDTTHPLPTQDYDLGWTYKVAEDGTYAGNTCEVGDMLICSATTGTAASDWVVVQANIDGAVTGPASAVDGQLVAFNGSTGKIVKASEYSVATASDLPSDLGTASAGSSTALARADHVHEKPEYGNISVDGEITSATTVGNGDKLIISKSADGKLFATDIAFDGSTTTHALGKNGQWIEVNNYVLPVATTTELGGVIVGTGLSVANDGTLDNAGVRAVATGSTNGTIAVNTGGTSSEVMVAGISTAAFHPEEDFATSTHIHSFTTNTITGLGEVNSVTSSIVTSWSTGVMANFEVQGETLVLNAGNVPNLTTSDVVSSHLGTPVVYPSVLVDGIGEPVESNA